MTLYNAASRARNVGRLVNRNSGGGNKKSGLFPQIGRTAWTSIYFGTGPTCCYSLARSRIARYPATCSISRPIGSTTMVGWNC
jgi:hypothetical protein